ncbi:MAG: DUF1800 domain-containing protein [Planctomycetota bacterium]
MGVTTKQPWVISGPVRSPKVALQKPCDPAWAWAPYQPDAERPWNRALAGHLYRRAGFGATWLELEQALADGPQKTADKLLAPRSQIDEFNRTYDEYDAAAASSDSGDALRAWWLRRMIDTPDPLLEKMTLFWHGHFAINGSAVKSARLMRQYVQLLRCHALASFRDLFEAVSHDPAVLTGLGASAHHKARPNESFARWLMDPFTLGPGHVSEADVRDVARAFTGWFVRDGELRFVPREHDGGIKRILGQEGHFTGDDVVRLLLEHKATSETLVLELYRWLISETERPEAAVVAPLIESFSRDADLRKLVETMLRSNLFFSPAAYRQRIKSPVEFAVGIARSLEGVVPTTRLAHDLATLGQNLYYPPAVAGWAGGTCWIDDLTLIRRHNLALALLRGTDPYGDKLDPRAIATKHGFSTPPSAARFLIDLLLQGDLDQTVADTLVKSVPPSGRPGGESSDTVLRHVAHAIVTLPEFQLS